MTTFGTEIHEQASGLTLVVPACSKRQYANPDVMGMLWWQSQRGTTEPQQ